MYAMNVAPMSDRECIACDELENGEEDVPYDPDRGQAIDDLALRLHFESITIITNKAF